MYISDFHEPAQPHLIVLGLIKKTVHTWQPMKKLAPFLKSWTHEKWTSVPKAPQLSVTTDVNDLLLGVITQVP
jgi:hypothetical protein